MKYERVWAVSVVQYVPGPEQIPVIIIICAQEEELGMFCEDMSPGRPLISTESFLTQNSFKPQIKASFCSSIHQLLISLPLELRTATITEALSTD